MRIYPFSSSEYTPEQIATIFAMTSRSPDTFDTIAERVSEAKSAEFMRRVYLNYGHASVGEHAHIAIAVEGISRLAADAIEDNRLASFTEQSSRYQPIDAESYYPGNE